MKNAWLVISGLTAAGCVSQTVSMENLACEDNNDCIEEWTCDRVAGVCVEVGECEPSGSEVCDGVDNDCNGLTDESFDLGADCGTGECAGGVTVCRGDATGITCSTDGTTCGDGVCNECSAGSCDDSPAGVAGPGCDDATDDDCTHPDTCGPGGICNANHEVDGASCGDGVCNECAGGVCDVSPEGQPGPGCTGAVTACSGVDACDAAGGCTSVTMPNGTPCDADSDTNTCDDSCQNGFCTADVSAGSGQPCDDGLYCNGTETCNGTGSCGSSTGNPCPGHDIGPNCNDSCDEDADNCLGRDADSTACDDGLFCNGTETCTEGSCQNSTGNPCPGHNIGPDCDDSCDEIADNCGGDDDISTVCDDGLYCNGTETCNGGSCGSSTGNPCSGHNTGPNCNDSCDEDADDCGALDALYTICGSGAVACATEMCDGAGTCDMIPTYCDDLTPGDVCWPACSADLTGCVTPPTDMDLACTSPVAVDTPSSCIATLTGGDNTGQGACLPCYAEVGIKSLGFADFADSLGGCSLDGWSLDTTCYSDPWSCPMSNLDGACCTSHECATDIGGTMAFQADRAVCSTGVWRLQRPFNTTGLTDVQVCFDYASDGAGANEVLQIDMVANGTAYPDVFCDEAGPKRALDNQWSHVCVDLPPAADDEANLQVILFMSSSTDGDRLAIDNLEVIGWGGGCTPDVLELVHETFDDCTLPDWDTAGAPTCPGWTECNLNDYNLGVVENDSWSISRTVDASELDGQVELCFSVMDYRANSGESIQVEFNPGTGWQNAWLNDGDLGWNDTCGQVCVNLANIDPAVNNNPALGIRVSMVSNALNDELAIDDIILRGARYCQVPATVVNLSSPSDNGHGIYDFTVQDTHGEQLAAEISCTWDPDPTLQATDRVDFNP